HGCLGWAVSAALDNSLLQQRTERLDELLEIIKADDEERFSFAARLATQFNQNRGLVQERLDLWLGWWRDLLLVKVGLSGDINNIDCLDTFIDMAKSYRLAQIKAFINSIRVAGEQLRQNANPQLVLEVLMLDIPEVAGHDAEHPAAQFEVKYG
ncbi:DNA polymerase III subunit delta' C-terminal domain-containing protein, partial [Chloroflexota bacterium]